MKQEADSLVKCIPTLFSNPTLEPESRQLQNKKKKREIGKERMFGREMVGVAGMAEEEAEEEGVVWHQGSEVEVGAIEEVGEGAG
jgi:hypothetical protein